MDIRDAGNHLALTLAVTAIRALGRAGMLTEVERKRCASRMKEFATQAEKATTDEQLPPVLATDLHAIALQLLQDPKSPGS